MASTRLVEAESRRPGGAQTGGALALAEVMPRLVLESRRVSGTLAHGLHGRRRAGPGESFWQFRPFVPGAAAARIDWRPPARADRPYLPARAWAAAPAIWLWTARPPSLAFRSEERPLGADCRSRRPPSHSYHHALRP